MSSRSTPGVASAQIDADNTQRVADRTFTPVGVDVGVKRFAVAATPDGVDTAVIAGEGEYARQLFGEFCAATARCGLTPEFDDTSFGDVVARYWPLFEQAFEAAAETVLTYAQQRPNPVLVLEELPSREPLYACRHGRLDFSTWCPPTVQAVLAQRAAEVGVPTTYVSAHNSSQECHRCESIGDLDRDALTCSTESCPVDEVCRDKSAAVTIAQRGRDQL